MHYSLNILSKYAAQIELWAESNGLIDLVVEKTANGELHISSQWDGEDHILVTDVLQNMLIENPGIEVAVKRKSRFSQLI